MPDYRIFEAGNAVLQSGLTYRSARLAYKTYGTLDAAKSNVILYPTSYGAQHYDLEWAIPWPSPRPNQIFIVISISSAMACPRRRATPHRPLIALAGRNSQ